MRKNPIITPRELKQMGCLRYGFISQKKRILGYSLIVMSFIIPDLGIGLVSGMCVLGISPKLLIKKAKIELRQRWLLW